MNVINFSVSNPLKNQIDKTIQEKGFQSTAEFFRFAAFNYIYNLSYNPTEEEKFEYLEKRLAKLLKEKFANKRLPSVKKQLQNV